jgi:hypothetical protein
MSTKQIEMLQEQVDAIVIAELQEALELNVDWGVDGQSYPDFELIHALRTLLHYYMGAQDFAQYGADLVKRQEKKLGKK